MERHHQISTLEGSFWVPFRECISLKRASWVGHIKPSYTKLSYQAGRRVAKDKKTPSDFRPKQMEPQWHKPQTPKYLVRDGGRRMMAYFVLHEFRDLRSAGRSVR